MNYKLKAAVLGVLIAASIFCAGLALTDLGYAGSRESGGSAAAGYVLRDYEGNVAVFVENDPERPMTVTDIKVDTLRQVDRDSIETGMKVAGEEKLMMLLEDLGS